MADEKRIRRTEKIIDSHTPKEQVNTPSPPPGKPSTGHTPLDIIADLKRNPPRDPFVEG